VAFELLRAVDQRNAYANLLLPRLLRENGLTGRDAAFATELAYGTLRALGRYDLVLAHCVDRPLEALDGAVRDVLRLGAHQLLGGLRVPPHAAVSASVDLARAAAGPGPARLVNAVLRRVSEHDPEAWLRRICPDPREDPVGALALRHDHPRWVAQAFLDALGGNLDELREALEAAAARPRTQLAARPGRITREALVADAREAGLGAEPGRLSPYAVVLDQGDPGRLAAVRDGRAGVQDEGSQLTAIAIAGPEVSGDRRWLDLCSGPGGKAALLDGWLPTGARHWRRLTCTPTARSWWPVPSEPAAPS
jgi:16S rRNA (cytosine967-C5)-methyltransferase